MQNLTKFIRAFALLAIAFLALATANFAQSSGERPEVGEYADAYRGEKNLQVTIVRFGKRENKEAIVEIVGLDHPWNRKIFRVEVEDWTAPSSSNAKIDYKMQQGGEDYHLLTRRGDRMILYLRENGDTGRSQEYDIYYSKELSDQTRSEYLLTAYLEQQKNPTTSTAKYNPKKTSTTSAQDAGTAKKDKKAKFDQLFPKKNND